MKRPSFPGIRLRDVTPRRIGGMERTDDDSDQQLDPLVESVDDECPTCGAWMLNPALHRAWHARILDEARRYKPPPRYG